MGAKPISSQDKNEYNQHNNMPIVWHKNHRRKLCISTFGRSCGKDLLQGLLENLIMDKGKTPPSAGKFLYFLLILSILFRGMPFSKRCPKCGVHSERTFTCPNC